MPPARSVVQPRLLENVRWQCTRRLFVRAERRRPFSHTSFRRTSVPASAASRLHAGYFSANSPLARFAGLNGNGGVNVNDAKTATIGESQGASLQSAASNVDSSVGTSLHPNGHLPHRMRQAAKRRNAVREPPTLAPGSTASSSPSASAASTAAIADTHRTPPDASSILANLASRHPAHSLRRRLSALLSLSKPRLTVLVVLTAMASYALYPVPAFLSPTALADAPSLSPLTLLFLTAGTTLCSASANALNMIYELTTDALMSRTRARPLVRGLIPRSAAVFFALGCAASGAAALWVGVNPTVAGLGVANIVLYAGVYTPLKGISWLNTWVGAVVGGIPPLMGWAAAAGESATGDGGWKELLFCFPDWAASWTAGVNDATNGPAATSASTSSTVAQNRNPSSLGGWLLAGILFAWEFPHFMALSWGVREEYRVAGLKMLSWIDPARNARVALRYGLVFVPLCVGLCAAGVTEWSFAVTSLPVNAWLAKESIRFWRLQGGGGSAKGLFWASVWHLPAVMVLALAQKKGMWGRVWRSVAGAPFDEDDEFEDWEEDAEGE